MKSSKMSKEEVNTLVSKLSNKTDMFDFISLNTFYMKIAEDKYLFWDLFDLLTLGEIIEHETGLRVLSLTTVANGENPDPKRLVSEIIEPFAKEGGFNRILLDGRVGWKKVFPGYKHSSTILYKEL